MLRREGKTERLARIKADAYSAFPRAAALYRKGRALGERLFAPSMERVFGRIYRDNHWGSAESASGEGSTLASTARIRVELPRLLRELGVMSLLDAPCGDFNWMRHVDLAGISYTGMDVVPQLIRRNNQLYRRPDVQFVIGDITRGPLPRADAVLCRDALEHLSFRQALRAVEAIKKSGSEYLLATSHESARNEDIPSGHWRPLDLRHAPFDFPEPLTVIVESEERGKLLCLWPLRDL